MGSIHSDIIMVRLHLCGVVLLCVWLCIDITEGVTEKSTKLGAAKSKVKDVISNLKKPSTSGAASGGGFKDKIKKLKTKENKDKAKKAAKKLKTKKKKTPGWVVGVIVVVVILLVLGIAGFIYYRKKKSASYDEAPVSDTNEPV